MKKILRLLNQPLVVGLLILVSTSLVQHCGFRAQQRILAKQLRASAVMVQAETTIDQLAGAVGKVLTASATIVGAHEAKVKTAQLNEIVDRYDALLREWDVGEDLLKLRIRTKFSVPRIASDWSSLLDRLGQLDSEVTQLHGFSTTDPSEAHQRQIAQCRQTITDVENRLAAMTDLMTNQLNNSQY